jgi:hypothetical protein
MAVNKVIYGGNTLVDLTGDTVTAADLADGVKATGADGNPVIGLMQKVTIDAELSTTSTNPVQNKVVTEALANVEVDTATNSEIDAALNLAEIGVLPENGVVPVSMGGTGAVTATEARANLGASATTDFASIAFTGSYKDLNDKPAFALINNTVLSGLTVVDNLEIKNALNIPGGQIWIE